MTENHEPGYNDDIDDIYSQSEAEQLDEDLKQNMQTPLRIISLEAENVKRLKAIRINPDKTLVKIEGKNAAGKSSVLDAIAAALGGGKRCPEVPVRLGERRAHVIVDMGDYVVTRKWTDKGHTTLEVTNKEGVPQKSPQALLDALVGDLTFDPLEFVRCAPVVQQRILMELAGLDFEELDQKRQNLYDDRTDVNRQLKQAKAQAGTVPDISRDAGVVDLASLTAENENAQRHNDERLRCKGMADSASNRLYDLAKDREEINAKHAESVKHLAEVTAKLSSLPPEADTGDLAAKLDEAIKHNGLVAARHEWDDRNKRATDLQRQSDKMTDDIAAIDDDKAKRLREAKFPLPGLSVADDGVILNGLPLSQASSSEQLRCAVAIGLSGNARTRIALVREGSLLDDDSMEILRQIAEDMDAQVFIERVASSASPSAVFIEDGEIA